MSLTAGFVDTILTASQASILAPGVGQTYTFTKGTATNTDSVARTITLYRVPLGGTAGSGNLPFVDALSIGAGLTVTLPMSGMTLASQAFISAAASTASVVQLGLSYVSSP
jgi:hypothetical protein